MRQRTRNLIAAGAVATLVAGGTVAVVGSATAATTSTAKTALGLSSNGKNLSVVDLRTAKRIKALGKASGLSGDTKLVGIDQRNVDRRYYGVGDQGGVYLISANTGIVRKVSQLSIALQGTNFGVDFNPAADRLRIISDTGQSLRHDVTNTASPVTVNDGALNYPTGTPPVAGAPAKGITAAAYTNSDTDTTTGTTLYNFDTLLDQVVQQVPANAGTLVLSGPSGIKRGPIAGMDIYSVKSNGRTVENIGFATARPTGGGTANLFKVDLTSGKFTKVAKFNSDIADIAVAQSK